MKKNDRKEPQEVETEAFEPKAKKKKGKRIANIIINVILVIAIIIAAAATYISFVSTSGNGVPSIFGIEIMSIQTESMFPTLSPGDLIFDVSVKDTSALQIDDIITYWTIIDGERVLNTHRIVEIYDGGGYLIFETKGDNNTVSDALSVHESEIVGQWKGFKIGGLGKVFDYLQTSTGFLVVVVVPVALFFIFHLIQFFRVIFEYNNVKNKLRYEQERGKNEDIIDEEREKMEKTKKEERERLEAELREKLKAELLGANAPKPEAPPAEAPVEEAPAKEEPAEEKPAEQAPAEEKKSPTEEELRAEIEAKVRAEYEAKIAAEAAEKAAAEKASEDKTAE